jgi:hypothetical protein
MQTDIIIVVILTLLVGYLYGASAAAIFFLSILVVMQALQIDDYDKGRKKPSVDGDSDVKGYLSSDDYSRLSDSIADDLGELPGDLPDHESFENISRTPLAEKPEESAMLNSYPLPAEVDTQAIEDELMEETDAYNVLDDYDPIDYAGYSKQWSSNQQFNDCYNIQPEVLESCAIYSTRDVDGKNALMAKYRSRDKKSLDGAYSKNANYFDKNFGEELNKFESKQWWGNFEY